MFLYGMIKCLAEYLFPFAAKIEKRKEKKFQDINYFVVALVRLKGLF